MSSSEGHIKRRIGQAMDEHHAEIELNMEIIRNYHPNQTRAIQSSCPLRSYLLFWNLDTEEKRWKGAACLWDGLPMCKNRWVTRLDKIRNTAIRGSLNFHISIVNRVCAKQLTCFGHVNRMPPFRFPKITFEGIIPGKRFRGRPWKAG